jgi:hypothetical protein
MSSGFTGGRCATREKSARVSVDSAGREDERISGERCLESQRTQSSECGADAEVTGEGESIRG